MRFKYLVESCALKHKKITKKEAEILIRGVFEDIADALANGETITIKNFGSFKTVVKSEKLIREPREGRLVQVPRKTYPKFEAAPALRAAVNLE